MYLSRLAVCRDLIATVDSDLDFSKKTVTGDETSRVHWGLFPTYRIVKGPAGVFDVVRLVCRIGLMLSLVVQEVRCRCCVVLEVS